MNLPAGDVMLVLAVMAGSMALFVSGKLRIDVVALCTLSALLLLGLIEENQALYGFSSPATATVAAMFVLTAGLTRTGSVQWLLRHLDRAAGKGEVRLLFVLCVSIAFLSAFIINTGTVAIFIPLAITLAKARKIAPPRVLMPVSFASQFGGVCTLVGTSTNILVNAIAVSYGMRPFGFFEFAPLGLVMSAAGIAYLIFVTPRLMPKRKGAVEQVDKYRLADYLAELRVEGDSPLIGDYWDQGEARQEKDVGLLKVIREDRATARSSRTKIREGDILLLHGNMERLLRLQEKYGLRLEANKMSDQELRSHQVRLVEVLIPPRSRLDGRRLDLTNFQHRFGGVVLAVQRRGKVLRERLGEITLEDGDSLLVECDADDVKRLLKSDDLIVTDELTELYIRKDRAFSAILILAAVVTLAALELLPIHVAAIVGAVAIVLARCLTIEEAYQAVNWQVIFLLGGILPLGVALQQTGAAGWLANIALGPLVGFGPLMLLAVLYITTALLTETMSNNASAVILAPIAYSLATAMGADPRPFLVAITFAASTSFATPIGYKTNAMIYAPGGYKFTDYTLVGGPLNILFWILSVLLIPTLWPLRP